MDTIYDLYAGDEKGLLEITGRFLQQLEYIGREAALLYRQQNWELLHRHTHQLKATAALYEVPGLCRLLAQVSDQTRACPANATGLQPLVDALPAAVAEAVQAVQNKLKHVT